MIPSESFFQFINCLERYGSLPLLLPLPLPLLLSFPQMPPWWPTTRSPAFTASLWTGCPPGPSLLKKHPGRISRSYETTAQHRKCPPSPCHSYISEGRTEWKLTIRNFSLAKGIPISHSPPFLHSLAGQGCQQLPITLYIHRRPGSHSVRHPDARSRDSSFLGELKRKSSPPSSPFSICKQFLSTGRLESSSIFLLFTIHSSDKWLSEMRTFGVWEWASCIGR
jgi:hypothetical protein